MANPLRKREQGAAMFLAVMLLVLMGAIGLVALDTATSDRRIAGFQNRSSAAFQAAEAGVASAAERARSNILSVPLTNLSDVGVYDREGGALPSYRADPALGAVNPNGIMRAPGTDGAADGVPPEAGGGWKTARWQINVEGRSPNVGVDLESRMSTARVELVYGTLTHGGNDYKGQ